MKKFFIGTIVLVNTLYPTCRMSERNALKQEPLQSVVNNKEYYQKAYPSYNDGGVKLSEERTTGIDLKKRYYNGDFGSYDYQLAKDYSFPFSLGDYAVNFNNLEAHISFLPNGIIGDYSACVSSASISILKFLFKNATRLNTSLESISNSDLNFLTTNIGYLTDNSFGWKYYTSHPTYSGEKYKDSDLYLAKDLPVTEMDRSQFITGPGPLSQSQQAAVNKIYNAYVKICYYTKKYGAGGASIANALQHLVEDEYTLSNNKRLSLSTKHTLNSGIDSLQGIIQAINSGEPVMAGDDDFDWPKYNNSNPGYSSNTGGHAFLIVGYGYSSVYNQITKNQDRILEFIYDQGNGELSAMPYFDICDWFELKLIGQKRTKNLFGWTSWKQCNLSEI